MPRRVRTVPPKMRPDHPEISSPVLDLSRRAEGLRRVSSATRIALDAATFATAAACILLAAGRSLGAEIESAWAAVAPLVGLAAGFAAAYARGARPPSEAAHALDEHYGLKSRLSTALALAPVAAGSGPEAEIARAVLRDAESRARGLDPRPVAPGGHGRSARRCLASCGLLAALALFYPQMDLLGLRERAERRAAFEDARSREVERIRELAAEARESKILTDRDQVALPVATELERLADEIEPRSVSASAAIAKIAETKKELEEERERIGESEARIPPEDARAMRSPEGRELARAVRAKEFERAARTADSLADALESGEMDASRREAVAADLARIAESVERSPELAKNLSEAAESAPRGAGESAAPPMRRAAETLERMADGLRAQSELSRVERELTQVQRNLGQAAEQAGEGAPETPAPSAEGDAESGGAEAEKSPAGSDDARPESSRSGESEAREGEGERDAGERPASDPAGEGASASDSGSPSDAPGKSGESDPGEAPEAESATGSPEAPRGARNPLSGEEPGEAGSPSDAEGGASGQTPPPGGEPQDEGASPEAAEGSSESPPSGGPQSPGESGKPGSESASRPGERGTSPGDSANAGGPGSEGGESDGGTGEGESKGAGTGEGQGEGRGDGQGEGSGQGQGEGEGGEGQGKGAGRDFGVGTSSDDEGKYATGNDPGEAARISGDRPDDWEREFMRRQAAAEIGATTFDARATGVLGESGGNSGERSTDAEVLRGRLAVPMSERLAETSRREKSALERQRIPLEYKDAVRSYFDSLERPPDGPQPQPSIP